MKRLLSVWTSQGRGAATPSALRPPTRSGHGAAVRWRPELVPTPVARAQTRRRLLDLGRHSVFSAPVCAARSLGGRLRRRVWSGIGRSVGVIVIMLVSGEFLLRTASLHACASLSVFAFSSATTCVSVSSKPSCALLASSAFSRLLIVPRLYFWQKTLGSAVFCE
jgi:hypothetical protein